MVGPSGGFNGTARGLIGDRGLPSQHWSALLCCAWGQFCFASVNVNALWKLSWSRHAHWALAKIRTKDFKPSITTSVICRFAKAMLRRFPNWHSCRAKWEGNKQGGPHDFFCSLGAKGTIDKPMQSAV